MSARPLMAALVVLVTLSLAAAPIPAWGFRYEPEACCCHHAGQCPCAGHHLPKHEQAPTARSCGSGGQVVDVPAAAPSELPPPVITIVRAEARPSAAAPLPSPHAAPELDRPSAPS